MTHDERPKGYNRKFTDDELRRDLDQGLSQSEIAAKHGVTTQAVSKRIRNMQVATTAAVVQPEEAKRFTGANIDAMAELAHSLRRVNLLMDACDDWLRDPERPERYTLDHRAEEVKVVYKEMVDERDDGTPIFEKRRGDLAELLRIVERGLGVAVVSTERQRADPRELVLKTAGEVRQTVNTLVELGQLLVNLQSMERYREKFLEVLEAASPEIRDAVVEAVRRDLLLSPAFGGAGSVPVAG